MADVCVTADQDPRDVHEIKGLGQDPMRKPKTAQHKANISKTMSGKSKTAQHKKNISESMKLGAKGKDGKRKKTKGKRCPPGKRKAKPEEILTDAERKKNLARLKRLAKKQNISIEEPSPELFGILGENFSTKSFIREFKAGLGK